MRPNTPTFHVPITDHPDLPEGVPLVAMFHDARNRLSYYLPLLRGIEGVPVPDTEFFTVTGDADSFFTVEYREITRFMQDLDTVEAFVRGDHSSGKYRGEAGSKITSQDPLDIEETVTEMFKQLCQGKRRIGGRIAVREWIPHDVETRYFIRDGELLYREPHEAVSSYDAPDEIVRRIAERFDAFAWSVDLIKHEVTGEWFVIDMGLDGLQPNDGGWLAISEHTDPNYSPDLYADEMPGPLQFRYRRP